VGHRKLTGAVGGGLCAASFGLILASAVSHLSGPTLYILLIVVFLIGAALFGRAASPGHVDVGGTAERGIEQVALSPPPPSLPSRDLRSRPGMDAEIQEPFIAGDLLRINVRAQLGRNNSGKYYAEAFGINGQFPASLLPGPWRVPWNDAPAGRSRYIDWKGTDLRLGEWPEGEYGHRKRRGSRNARMTFLEAGNPMRRWEVRGTGPWQIVVRLRREGSDVYMDAAFDIALESGQLVFQKA
jgi:hypothetical protein